MEFAFVVSVVVGAVGYSIGMMIGTNRGRQNEPERVRPVCPCAHTVGEHKDGGRCLAEMKRQKYNHYGHRSGHEYVHCACTKYHGPAVIDNDFFHPGEFRQ